MSYLLKIFVLSPHFFFCVIAVIFSVSHLPNVPEGILLSLWFFPLLVCNTIICCPCNIFSQRQFLWGHINNVNNEPWNLQWKMWQLQERNFNQEGIVGYRAGCIKIGRVCFLASCSLLLLHSFLAACSIPCLLGSSILLCLPVSSQGEKQPTEDNLWGFWHICCIYASFLNLTPSLSGWLPDSHYDIRWFTPARVDWPKRKHLIQTANWILSPHILIHFKTSSLIQGPPTPVSMGSSRPSDFFVVVLFCVCEWWRGCTSLS